MFQCSVINIHNIVTSSLARTQCETMLPYLSGGRLSLPERVTYVPGVGLEGIEE